MKKIKLTQNKYALIDNEDFDLVNQYKWYYSSSGYAEHDTFVKNKKKAILMHRLITNCPNNKIIDHKNHNPLDNRKVNLRIVTQHENQFNRSKINKNNLSGFTGISWHKLRNKWRSRVMLHGKEIHLGLFIDKQEAIKARSNYMNSIGGGI